MHTARIIAFLLFVVAAVCAVCKRGDWALGLVASGLAVLQVPAVFGVS